MGVPSLTWVCFFQCETIGSGLLIVISPLSPYTLTRKKLPGRFWHLIRGAGTISRPEWPVPEKNLRELSPFLYHLWYQSYVNLTTYVHTHRTRMPATLTIIDLDWYSKQIKCLLQGHFAWSTVSNTERSLVLLSHLALCCWGWPFKDRCEKTSYYSGVEPSSSVQCRWTVHTVLYKWTHQRQNSTSEPHGALWK